MLTIGLGNPKSTAMIWRICCLPFNDHTLRARKPRPYLDKKTSSCPRRGGVSPPGIFFSRMLKKQAVDLGHTTLLISFEFCAKIVMKF